MCETADLEASLAKYSKEQIYAAIDAAFGLESLKHQQREPTREFVSGRDVFVALPTGFGKSYCFALLPTVFDHLRAGKNPSIMVCVSQLTALMMELLAMIVRRRCNSLAAWPIGAHSCMRVRDARPQKPHTRSIIA